MNPDDAYKSINNIIQESDNIGNLSETDTRCKLIDRVLKECLDYPEVAIKREISADSGRMDYLISVNSIPFLVIEAKRNGETFEIPTHWTKRFYKLNGIIKSNSILIDAISQVRSYCFDIGVKFAMVSNGTQYVAFAAFASGKKWDDGICVIYNSLNDISANFTQFWNTFSYESLINGSFLKSVEGKRNSLTFRKLSNELHNPDQKWERNRIYTYLADIMDYVFTELIDSQKINVLKKCYVYERVNEDLGKDLGSLFIDKMPYFSSNYDIKSIVETETKAGSFEKKIRELRRKETELPMVVLLGGIGSGKSTFIHRFFRVIMEERETLFWYYLDFRYSSFEQNGVEDFIYDQIIEQFHRLYESKIESKFTEIGFSFNYSDKYEYISRIFAMQKLLRISPIIIIDNVDQHEYKFQEKLFLFANKICKALNVLTILALREETFIRSTRTGVFGAYMVAKYHISSPNFIQMIKSRILFSLELLHDPSYLERKSLESDIVTELIHFFEILLRSFNKDNEQSQRIVHFFDSISVGNMRESLRMFSSFLVSGNTNIDEMFEKEAKGDHETFQIAYHQLLKSIILGEYRFYSSKRSHIANIFDFDSSMTDSHFQQLRILRFLDSVNNTESPVGRGYISFDELFSKTEEVLITKNIIIDSVLRMLKFNLVSLDNQSNESIENANYITITPSGKFYLYRLVTQNVYLNAIIVDTPISDKELMRSVRLSLNNNNIAIRILNTRNFVKYLVYSEEVEFIENPQYLHSDYSNKRYMVFIKEKFNRFVSTLIEDGNLENKPEYFV